MYGCAGASCCPPPGCCPRAPSKAVLCARRCVHNIYPQCCTWESMECPVAPESGLLPRSGAMKRAQAVPERSFHSGTLSPKLQYDCSVVSEITDGFSGLFSLCCKQRVLVLYKRNSNLLYLTVCVDATSGASSSSTLASTTAGPVPTSRDPSVAADPVPWPPATSIWLE